MNIQGLSPAITAPLHAQNANTATATGSASNSTTTGSSSLSSTSLESTFLNLLATELQNQDPTSPVDPTAMVGQLVSLNQLDQLISINQTLSNLTASGSGNTTTSQGAAANAVSTSGTASKAALQPSSSTSTLASLSQMLPTNPVTAGANELMNLYGSFAAPAPAQTPSFSPIGGR